MNKLVLTIGAIFLAGMFFSSCEKCMTCDLRYDKAGGEEISETTPQVCGTSNELDEKEDQFRQAYSKYDSLRMTCNRE